jgi:hypothetical protein
LGGFGQRLHAFDDNRSIAHFMRIAEADSPIFEGFRIAIFNFLSGCLLLGTDMCFDIHHPKERLPMITSGLIMRNKNGKFIGI